MGNPDSLSYSSPKNPSPYFAHEDLGLREVKSLDHSLHDRQVTELRWGRSDSGNSKTEGTKAFSF